MKSDSTTTILNFVLVFLAVCGVICAILTFSRTRDSRTLTSQANVDKDLLMRVQALAGEINAYNQKFPSPQLTQILQSVQPHPANR